MFKFVSLGSWSNLAICFKCVSLNLILLKFKARISVAGSKLANKADKFLAFTLHYFTLKSYKQSVLYANFYTLLTNFYPISLFV
mmetsp:Transcript_2048/g.259  ORF Transcript_2048/g.259 Transcript_2048/m.259 type:complete len:84 (+) Transcript_2048:244-495(+)